MKAVYLPEPALREIHRHAREAFPDECCGFLIARADDSERHPRLVVSVERASNEYEGARRRRFVIGAAELRALERRLDGSGTMVGGFYHSHPDHPARPSEFDRDHAWPWYAYLVLGVTEHTEGPVGAFELDLESDTFVEVPLTIVPDPEFPGGKRTPMSVPADRELP